MLNSANRVCSWGEAVLAHIFSCNGASSATNSFALSSVGNEANGAPLRQRPANFAANASLPSGNFAPSAFRYELKDPTFWCSFRYAMKVPFRENKGGPGASGYSKASSGCPRMNSPAARGAQPGRGARVLPRRFASTDDKIRIFAATFEERGANPVAIAEVFFSSWIAEVFLAWGEARPPVDTGDCRPRGHDAPPVG